MKTTIIMNPKLVALVVLLSLSFSGIAQTAAKSTSIATGLGLYVFPSQNQDQATQDTDEAYCYKWAQEQTGIDPLNPTKIKAEQVDKSVDGTAVVGAAGGAAAGAAIGAIAGDAGKGAAIGAILGGLRGRRAKVVGDEMEQQKDNQAAAAQEKTLMDNYKKAFTACMEGKGYTVK
ncbi:glycine zipper domain-containing protein [Algoriphagus chordae]|uniref:Outer membrane protein with glycine zipper n=1 Tax=Algoriphagus chordae TaxID=237019 RepID=A0A2W7RM30_9BACT|nr:glycine zipper domain-containing protein [Algoriphagus chordae]PZX55579.1 outer membrane protein with glycine zipper [Algoriphagus chordae]